MTCLAYCRFNATLIVAELLEGEETFSRMLAFFRKAVWDALIMIGLPPMCFLTPVCGTDHIVPLDHLRTGLPENADCIYLHDVAVGVPYRSRGLAKQLIDAILDLGEQMRLYKFALVAVQDSESFWEQWGFERGQLLFYATGVAATHMVMVLKRSST